MWPRGEGSLQGWLARWLALLTFLAIGLVCSVVYVATSFNLDNRHQALLQQKMEVVQHLFDESALQQDEDSLNHKLQDFFIGRSEFSLAVDLDGQRLSYGGTGDRSTFEASRDVDFLLRDPRHAGASIPASIALDISADVRLQRVLAWTLLLCTVGGAIVAALVGSALARAALRPVQELAAQASALAPDRIGERLTEQGLAQELLPLVRQFNQVLRRLEAAYVQMEGFNADVAHELRTPLATLVGQTELALSSPTDDAAMREVMGSNLEELHRLSSIIRDMLFLSQADRGAIARTSWVGNLADLAREVAEYHEAEAEDMGVSLCVQGRGYAQVDRGLLQRALSNLLSNAIRYADFGSTVTLRVDERDDLVYLDVANLGTPIEPHHLPRLFHRLYRADEARAYDSNHHGLGLAIVDAIARMHGGRGRARCEERLVTIGFSVAVLSASPVTSERSVSGNA
ncbi:heavy metal sensor histidine kinase [Achromobacter sp. GG226]|uniref:heavy metal sensor histidine kinase n=1 Tax=Verticiella alkaliphila TaxID=2779529 RepID=UPI001C0CC81B|nr:heavy metal sensor histidine kinase [Verticiella sp. GG226]MBU4610336.1 heavy metal sensor histidine kinase [Verticiella sp. GG226]